MKLAINYSRPAAKLLQAGEVNFDFFKTPGWDWMIDEAITLRPIQVHFELRAGGGTLAETDWAAIEALQARTGTPFVNVHLAPYSEDFPEMRRGTQAAADVETITERLIEEVGLLCERFGAERVIAENVPFMGEKSEYPVLRPAAEPGVIRSVLEATGCGLLLDISHARIAARCMGWDEREYIESLPVERLRELHFTGLHRVNGGWMDHLPILQADWVELDWALERMRAGAWGTPWLLAFEYGGEGHEHFRQNSDPAVIAEQMPRLWERVEGI